MNEFNCFIDDILIKMFFEIVYEITAKYKTKQGFYSTILLTIVKTRASP